uniref:GRB2-related adapter protein-like n=2 Tax=Poecilia latipinna TaxID=48699 RepID=A0A3B3TTD5_9TELE
MEAVALFSFTASEADEISFQKGDIIKVVEMEEDSFWFTAEIEGKRGFIPKNYISLHPHLWFAGAISRLEAEQRLCWQDTGVFLVRESESAPGELSLSVRTRPPTRRRREATLLFTGAKPQRTGTEMGGNKYAHSCPATFTVDNFRVEVCPAPLKETGSRTRAIRRGETNYF